MVLCGSIPRAEFVSIGLLGLLQVILDLTRGEDAELLGRRVDDAHLDVLAGHLALESLAQREQGSVDGIFLSLQEQHTQNTKSAHPPAFATTPMSTDTHAPAPSPR